MFEPGPACLGHVVIDQHHMRNTAAQDALRTACDKRSLEAEEIEDVTDALTRGGVTVAGVGVAVDEAVLPAEEVEDVENAYAC